MSSDLSVRFGRIIEQPTLFPDEQGKLQVIVRNNGSSRFNGAVNLNLFASTDNFLDLKDDLGNDDINRLGNLTTNQRGANDPLEGTDEKLGTQRLNLNLAPNQSRTLTVDFASSQFRTASVVSPGAYNFFAEVNPVNAGSDSNIDNNTARQLITQGDVVIQWNSILLNTIAAVGKGSFNGNLNGGAPPIAARNQAIVHAAIFDAVNAFDKDFQSYLVDDLTPSAGASIEAAAVGAAYQALVQLYPNGAVENQQLRSLTQNYLDQQKNRSLNEIDDGLAAERDGFNFGVEVANRILQARSTDFALRAGRVPYEEGNDPGEFKPIDPQFQPATEAPPVAGNPPALPGFGRVTPFVINSVTQFRPDGPQDYGSPQYAREIEEVRLLGSKQNTDVTTLTRTPEQTEIAQFWAYDRDDTFRPPGQLNQLAQEVALAQNNTLLENARLFALLNIAQADAGIVGWDTKYTYNQIRPIDAIRGGDLNSDDNNPNSIQDHNWDSLLGTPNFPDYLSGHSIFGGASTQILNRFYGTDNISFDIPSQELPGVARSYNSFTEVAEEDAISRVYGGVHIDLATVDGVGVGQDIANFIFDNALQPI
jgi:hypothetical protein